ncbi:MAG: hypothetical protein IKR44_00485 [Bacteroidales bacterium]|nr:hypothetical protein [Bacteroidales bacterium]
MKKLAVTLIFIFISLGAWAQYAGSGTIRRAGTHIEMDGERLSPDAQAALLANIGGKDYNAVWEHARKGRRTGTGLTIGGGATFLAGGAVGLLGLTTSVLGAAVGGTVGSIGGQEGAQHGAEEGAKAGGPMITAGLIAAGLGLVATGIGIPMIVSNTRMMNGIVNTYNNGNRPSASVSFGATDNGIGLALRF